MAAFGFSAEAVAAMRAEATRATGETALAIHPDNVVAVRWLLATQTQWRWVSLSTMQRAELRRTGLDYPAVEVTARQRGLETTPDDFARLQVLEAHCLTAWAEEVAR